MSHISVVIIRETDLQRAQYHCHVDTCACGKDFFLPVGKMSLQLLDGLLINFVQMFVFPSE